MSDFEYLPEDENSVHVALHALKKADQSATLWATLVGIPLGYIASRPIVQKTKAPILSWMGPIFVASLWYVVPNEGITCRREHKGKITTWFRKR